MKKTWRNNLDEQQEQTLLKIEHNGCWFAFWALLAAMLIQQFIYGSDFRYFAGEWIVFMVLAVYIAVASLKNGIWDRHLKAKAGTNLIVSLIAAAVVAIFAFAMVFHRYGDKVAGSAATGIISGVFTFVLCFVILQIMMVSYKKRREKMDEEPEEEEL